MNCQTLFCRFSYLLQRVKIKAYHKPFHLNFLRNTSTFQATRLNLWEEYAKAKGKVEAFPLPRDRDHTAIYANNELHLADINVYGFDYDYTLACYKTSLHHLIYQLAVNELVTTLKYPKELETFAFNPHFAVRGLHVDAHKGLLLKIDAFHNIQMGTVYRGLSPVPDEEVIKLYYGTHVSIENMSSFYGTITESAQMHQAMDLFAIPEVTLYSNVVEYFVNNAITYDPEYVYYDVKTAVQGLHSSGLLHNTILNNLDDYIGVRSEIAEVLKRLSSAGKNLFLITNSGVNFVDRGMRYLVGPDWNSLFDVVITNARKPKFFYESSRPFRVFNSSTGQRSWNYVDKLEKGKYYQEGNFYQLSELTGWHGGQVLYFGDHVYTDLADATLKHGWRTGAIIPELTYEIEIINQDLYKKSVRWLVSLERLIEKMQIEHHVVSSQEVQNDPESLAVLKSWLAERDELRLITKKVFNPQFGSIFRTYHNPTYFTRRLNRFADIYMSSVVNLLNYPLSHTFYPRRAALPHEFKAL